MELIHSNIPRGHIRVALFDFDGTLSLLREGWPDIMRGLVMKQLLRTPRHEGETELGAFVTDVIYRTAGQQTIYQMIRFAEEIAKRGGEPVTPQKNLETFTERLSARVRERVAAIRSGAQPPDVWVVPGAVSILHALRARGVICYIASGTAEASVREEATLLGLAPYFADIFGAHKDYKNHSKKVIIGSIVEKRRLRAGELVTFGDGAPEIADTKAVGGIAVGVATNEETRDGVNPHKRAALLDAGADIIVPDFREQDALVSFLFAES